jgi:hypothetical protein
LHGTLPFCPLQAQNPPQVLPVAGAGSGVLPLGLAAQGLAVSADGRAVYASDAAHYLRVATQDAASGAWSVAALAGNGTSLLPATGQNPLARFFVARSGSGRGAAAAECQVPVRKWLAPRSRRRCGNAGTDAREPHFVIANNNTFVFSFFQAGVDPLAFEPNGEWGAALNYRYQYQQSCTTRIECTSGSVPHVSKCSKHCAFAALRRLRRRLQS